MIITKHELMSFVRNQLSMLSEEKLNDLCSGLEKQFFSEHNMMSADLTGFFDYFTAFICVNAEQYTECSRCGYIGPRDEYNFKTEVRMAENKTLCYNEEKQDYELKRKKYEITIGKCPGCGRKIIKTGKEIK